MAHLERGGTATPEGMPGCGTVCSGLRTKEVDASPAKSSSRALWRDLTRTRVATKVLPILRVAGPVGLSIGTVDLGYRIGSGPVRKFLHLGFDLFTGGGSPTFSISAVRMNPCPASGRCLGPMERWPDGVWTVGDDNRPVGAPEADYFLEWDVLRNGSPYTSTSQWEEYHDIQGGDANCPQPRMPGPTWEWKYQVADTASYSGCGWYPTTNPTASWKLTPWRYWATTAQMVVRPIEDYTDQPYTHEIDGPTATQQSTVDNRTRTFLELEPDGRRLEAWYDWALRTPGAKNPYTGEVNIPEFAGEPGQSYDSYAQTLTDLGLTPLRVEAGQEDYDWNEETVLEVNPNVGINVEPSTEVRVGVNPLRRDRRHPDCERYAEQHGDPAGSRGSEIAPRYQVKTYAPVPGVEVEESFQRNTGLLTETVYLRWGWTTLDRGNWARWGYRHIAAKHSWENDDRQDTAEALLVPPVPVLSDDQTAVHIGPDYPGRNGTRCQRVVRVALKPTERFEVPRGLPAKGIITSYPEAINL